MQAEEAKSVQLVPTGMTKDGFYLKDSDDSDVDEEQVLNRKQRKALKNQQKSKGKAPWQGAAIKDEWNSDDGSDWSDEEILTFQKNTPKQSTPAGASIRSVQTKSTAKTSLGKDHHGLEHKVSNSLQKQEVKIDDDRKRVKDKADRATIDNCLDPRTLYVLDKMVINKKINKLEGCISTGKEANVYHATGNTDLSDHELRPLEPDEEGNPTASRLYAVKIFKTSILIFKDRERYVEGEFRFRKGHCKGNPRKMVKLWAEKEVRNLKKIGHTNGLIKVPHPWIFKNNIIVMDFIGTGDDAAPRLKDAGLSEWTNAYEQTLLVIRRMYQRCKLVHADLSEYNLLWHEGEIWVIDVSQAVETEHPMALDFLRRDCGIINDFFIKKNVNTITTKDTFYFTTSINIENDDETDTLTDLLNRAVQRNEKEKEEDRVQDAVFKQIYIPRTLHEFSLEDIVTLQRENRGDELNKLTHLSLEGARFESLEELQQDKEMEELKNDQS